MTPREKAENWLASNIDQSTKNGVEKLLGSSKDDELVESFYKDLEFGTGGLRGIMGVGSNRMNKYTVGMATQGLANHLKKAFPSEKISVAISHDSRNNSRYFAETVTNIFSANGIKVYFFKELRPTPELSFAIRYFGCKSGVMITASHNPKEYNGYKAYWDDGAQVMPPHDQSIIDEVKAISSFDDIKFEKDEANIQMIGEEVDEAYLKTIVDLGLSPEAVADNHDLKIVYSSIHGTGTTMVPAALRRIGFTNVNEVAEQAEPDGNFPTVIYPNPEEAEAMKMAFAKANEIGADLAMATDPDADRVGIAIRNGSGELQLVSGNQTGAMIVHYLLTRWKERGMLTGTEFVVNTVVTTDLIDKIAESFEVENFNTLTGFKHIAKVIRELDGKRTFIGGGEESYGYMIGDKVRDKDAVASCVVIAEMAAFAKTKGKSLFDTLMDIYLEHGLYKEGLISITKKGKSGAEEIQQMMADLRANPPKIINGSKVQIMHDYGSSISTTADGSTIPIALPKSNVLQFLTEDGSKISARPSGTEPKIKFYFSVNAPLSSVEEFEQVGAMLANRIEGIIDDMNLR